MARIGSHSLILLCTVLCPLTMTRSSAAQSATIPPVQDHRLQDDLGQPTCDMQRAIGALGNRSLLVIRVCVEIRGETICPKASEAHLRNILWRGGHSVDKLYSASTYGRIRFPECMGVVATVTLPNWSKGCNNVAEMKNAAVAVYANSHQWPKDGFHHMGYFVPNPPCRGLEFTWPMSFIISHGDPNGLVTAHEIGHQHKLWLPHNMGDANDDGRYEGETKDGADPTNPMGLGMGTFPAHFRARWGLIPNHAQPIVHLCNTKRYTVQALHIVPSTGGVTMLRIPRSVTIGGGEYSISYRANYGHDASALDKAFLNRVHVYRIKDKALDLRGPGDMYFLSWFDDTTICKPRLGCNSNSHGWVGQSSGGPVTIRVVERRADHVVLDVDVHGCESTTTTTTPIPYCTKWNHTGWHRGTYKKTFLRTHAPNGVDWTWWQCAERCAMEDVCEFWTLQLSGDGQCLMMANRGQYVPSTNHFEGPKVAIGACASYTSTSTIQGTTTTTSTAKSTTVTTTSTTTLTDAPSTTSAWPGKGIQSGDIIFLKTWSGNHIDVESGAVYARWESQGKFQALVIEKEDGGNVNSGDTVYLKTHTGAHIDVADQVVKARWEDHGGWQAMVIEKRSGDGAILLGDSVCFRAHTGKHLDVQGDVVQARWDDCGDWQSMLIQKEADGALFSGASIHLLAHTGKRVEVEGHTVQARWTEDGAWQTFVIENFGGRAIYSGDAVFLKAHTGALVDCESVTVQCRWRDWGAWQTFFIERKDGKGAVMPGDTIFLRAHTGKFIEVQGSTVRASWSEKGAWQSLVIEPAQRRLLGALIMV